MQFGKATCRYSSATPVVISQNPGQSVPGQMRRLWLELAIALLLEVFHYFSKTVEQGCFGVTMVGRNPVQKYCLAGLSASTSVPGAVSELLSQPCSVSILSPFFPLHTEIFLLHHFSFPLSFYSSSGIWN